MENRTHWQNCVFVEDKEILSIDAMEDSIGPLDETTVQIRKLITCFEACYHEADRQAELIIRAIGSGLLPHKSGTRPPQRKVELQNAHDILSAWCFGQTEISKTLAVGYISSAELNGYLGKPTNLKRWQVQRIIEQLRKALGISACYINMALDIDRFGQPITIKPQDHYKDHLDFLNQTAAAMIHYKLDRADSEMSLAVAIDLLRPCNWNFAGNLFVLLKAIGGDLYAKEIFAPCSLNARLTPLSNRLKIISNTLGAFWKKEKVLREIDEELLKFLGIMTPQKQWLAASLDKTIRLHLSL